MGTTEGFKRLADEFDRLELMGYLVDQTVRMLDTEDIHPDFRGKTGKVFINDPEDETVEVRLIDEPKTHIITHRKYYEVICCTDHQESSSTD